MARREYRFEDIAVVTNGCSLNDEKVVSAIVQDASAVRVSLYDWNADSLDGLKPTLRDIQALRERVDSSRSKLQIGVSALTTSYNVDVLGKVGDLARSAGAHWIYFHPKCSRDNSGATSHVNQSAVANKVKEYQRTRRDGFHVFALDGRFSADAVQFEGDHASHFILVIGGDGKHCLATEVKYQPQYAISDPANAWHDDFLWQRSRLERIRSVSSRSYPAKSIRNRGVLYNTFIEKLKRGIIKLTNERCQPPDGGFLLPHVI